LFTDGSSTEPAGRSAAKHPQSNDLASDHAGSQDVDVQVPLEKLGAVRQKLSTIIRGKENVIEQVLTAMLAGGSVLLEDVPGVGKTTLAKSLASLIELKFARIQCTPDLLPADILGSSIFQPSTGNFEFRPGPVFCDLLIADEVNRASPRTQSALLEAMAESQVTIDGNQYPLQQPFIVIATQNPGGFEGTFPLPESQLDRFLLRLPMDYPDEENEINLLLESSDESMVRGAVDPTDDESIMNKAELLQLQSAVGRVHTDRKVAQYIVNLVGATRRDSRLRVGCSPRGSKMLLRAGKAKAILSGRNYVIPDDIQSLAVSVIAHRLVPRSGTGNRSASELIVQDIVQQIEVPV
jgi:MoxR-like ATPase